MGEIYKLNRKIIRRCLVHNIKYKNDIPTWIDKTQETVDKQYRRLMTKKQVEFVIWEIAYEREQKKV